MFTRDNMQMHLCLLRSAKLVTACLISVPHAGEMKLIVITTFDT